MAHTHTFRGVEVPYDFKALHRWSVQKALTGAKGPAPFFDAIDQVLCGKSDEVAEALGDDTDVMGELMSELVALDKESKN